MNVQRIKNIQLFIMVLISVLLVVFVISGINGIKSDVTDAETARIKALVNEYVIQCYATEGAYPPNIQYLADHYGLILNEEKYIYEYEPVAENIKPVIQIFIRLDYK